MSSPTFREELERFASAVESASGYRPPIPLGASNEEIERAQAELGVVFGPQLRDLYLASNGGATDSVMSYAQLEHLLEPTEFSRAELTHGDLPDDELVRSVMDTVSLVAVVGALGDYWLISPNDPEERVYFIDFQSGNFGLIATSLLGLVSMHADLAEEGFVEVHEMRPGQTDVRWRRTDEGAKVIEAIYETDTQASLLAKYGIEMMP